MRTLSENEQKVLNHLKEGNLTTFQSVTLLHIMNVADVIMRLRRLGHNIDKVWKSSKNQKRFAVYYLV